MPSVERSNASRAGRGPSAVVLGVALAAVLALALVLRASSPGAGWFGVDQARDLAWARAIADGTRFPWTGPPMRNRIDLSAFYYYFWSLPALVSQEAPAFYTYAALLGALAVAAVFRLGAALGGWRAGLVAALLLATSPHAVLDSRVAWAPAALPLATAVFLLAAKRLVERPTTRRAATVALVAALATQLHLSAFPLCAVAGGLLLARWRGVGVRGILAAALVGALPFVPMLVGFVPRATVLAGELVRSRAATPIAASDLEQTRRAAGAPAIGDLRERFARRLLEIAAVRERALEGLSPSALERAWWTTALIGAQRFMLPLEGLAVALLWLRSRYNRHGPMAAVIAGTFFLSLAAVALLPAEAWYYYLDQTLVPGAVALGVLLAIARPRLAFAGATAVVITAQVLLVVWWIGSSARSGIVSANFAQLRLVGDPPSASESRLRFLNLDVKQAAADVLVRRLRIPRERIWQAVHGPGFEDLDSDNWFFFGAPPSPTTEENPDVSALVGRASDWPPSWTAGFAWHTIVGPIDIFAYEPRLRMEAGRVESCAAQTVVPVAARDPVRYGDGGVALPDWGCTAPVVYIPVVEGEEAIELRVFANVRGIGRVVALDAEPPAKPVTSPSGTPGLRLTPGTRVVRVHLAIRGPALLDVYELHGRRAAAQPQQAAAVSSASSE